MKDSLIDQVSFVAERFLNGPVRGIILRFSGLNTTAMRNDADPMELAWGQAGGLVVTPYHDPWGWMNPPTRELIDELVEGLKKRYRLDDRVPVIAYGGSMGGHGALVYTMLGKTKVSACMANCPATDLLFHYFERPDLPRTLHHAFGSYGPIEDALHTHSPLHQVDRLPDVPYFIVAGDADARLNKAQHADRLVAAMRSRGLAVQYHEVAGMEHCAPLPYSTWIAMRDFVLERLV